MRIGAVNYQELRQNLCDCGQPASLRRLSQVIITSEAELDNPELGPVGESPFVAITDDKALIMRLLRRATSMSCSVGKHCNEAMLPYLEVRHTI